TATHVDFAGRAAGADIGTVIARLRAHHGRRTGAQRNAVGVGGRRTGTQGQAVQADRLGTAAHRHRAIVGGRRTVAHGHGLVALGFGILARGDRILAGGAIVVLVAAAGGVDAVVAGLVGVDL